MQGGDPHALAAAMLKAGRESARGDGIGRGDAGRGDVSHDGPGPGAAGRGDVSRDGARRDKTRGDK
jgi:hypothetical protein